MNIRHIRLILKREYTQRLRSPGFVIGTIVGVLGITALAFLPVLLRVVDRQSTLEVAIVDPRDMVFRHLPKGADATPTALPSGSLTDSPLPLSSGIRFERAETTDVHQLSEQVQNGELDAYVVVLGRRARDIQFVYHSKDRPGPIASARLVALLSSAATQARLEESGLTPEQAQQLFKPPDFRVQPIEAGTLMDERVQRQSTVLVYFLLIFLYGTLLMYPIQVAMGVVEEKSSRVMEILITAVRPIELMIGKVLGIGLVGLTQYAVWVATGMVILLLGVAPTNLTAGAPVDVDLASVPASTLVFFLLFFVLGYLLFAFIYAALGSLVSRTEEVSGITTPLTILMVVTYILSIASLSSPETTFVRVASFIPFLTPMLMFIRVALSSPAWWELLLSVLLLLGSSLLFAWLAAKIYRVGVLLYGKRPSFRQIGQLLRSA